MIQKIQSAEYLRRVDNMPAEEKEAYLKRVGEWLDKQAPMILKKMSEDKARFQNALQCSATWNDQECQAWTEGARLLTALTAGGETWLPDMLYTKSARRAIRQMTLCIRGVLPERVLTDGQKRRIVERYVRKVQGSAATVAAVGRDYTPSSVTRAGVNAEKSVILPSIGHPGNGAPSPVPARPKHIDQYVHLLPKKTQERASTVRGLLRELDMARENARRLMDAGEHADKIAQWAKAATGIDAKIKAIYREIDAEWERLVREGRVEVDDFGNAHVVEAAETKSAEAKTAKEPKRPGRPPLTEEEKAARAAEKEAKRKADGQRKAALLRKFLIDRRNANTEAQREKWAAKYREMVGLGGAESVTDKVRETAAFYGIDLAGMEVETEN